MFPNAAQPTDPRPPASSVSSIAGKVFILGEYAVLADRPALIAAVGPRFSLRLPGRNAIHPRSPAGRLIARLKSRGVDAPAFTFEDPYAGAGGFGASTAQFALVYQACARVAGLELTALAARALYRELMSEPDTDSNVAIPPSGADLIAQWSGGVTLYAPARGSIQSMERNWNWNNLIVFSATGLPGRKVATHEHLEKLATFGFVGATAPSRLPDALEAVLDQTLGQDAAKLGHAMIRYAELLHDAGLEVDAARQDRLALQDLPGVLGAKGAGAMLADAVIVLMSDDSSAEARAAVVSAAKARGLRLIADGLESQKGIS